VNPDHLVCASCAHPVSEGRCATCRAVRLQQGRRGPLTPELLVVLIALVVALFVVAHLSV
jgi:hypothetical protein